MLLHWLDSPRGLHPSACASDFWTCPQTPPLTQFAQKGCQSTELELRIPLKYLKLCRSGSVNFWRGGPKNSIPPRPPLSPPPPIRPVHISIGRSRQEDSKYMILNRFDTCRPKVMLPTPSWLSGHFLLISLFGRFITISRAVQFFRRALLRWLSPAKKSLPIKIGGQSSLSKSILVSVVRSRHTPEASCSSSMGLRFSKDASSPGLTPSGVHATNCAPAGQRSCEMHKLFKVKSAHHYMHPCKPSVTYKLFKVKSAHHYMHPCKPNGCNMHAVYIGSSVHPCKPNGCNGCKPNGCNMHAVYIGSSVHPCKLNNWL